MSPSSAAGSLGKRCGRLPRTADPRDLQFATFARKPAHLVALPEATRFWAHRASFPRRTFGNDEVGDCTRAKQAAAALRMERLETRRTPGISDEEVRRVYFDMTERLYGGGDSGAYESDALSEWRKPDRTFKDAQGRPLTIDAYMRLSPSNLQQVKQALFLAGAHGIAVCFNLPAAWQTEEPPGDWDLPAGQALTGDWQPGSWGGHSMWARDYDARGLWVVHTWGLPDQRVSWRAVSAYMDEAHVVIDSLDFWRKSKPAAARALDLGGLREAVNDLSSYPIPRGATR